MADQSTKPALVMKTFLSVLSVCIVALFVGPATAWTSKDQTLTLHGFTDYTHHHRNGYGSVKNRLRGQLEFNKSLNNWGAFREISLNGTIRATYDGVFNWNDERFGDKSACAQFLVVVRDLIPRYRLFPQAWRTLLLCPIL